VLDRVNDFFREKFFPQKKFDSEILQQCCISIYPNTLHFVHARLREEKVEIVLCESFPYKNTKNIQALLTELVQKYALSGVYCSWILQPEQYQLLQTESLPVSPKEFQAAIRWKVKELLSFPIQDAVIDSFPIPVDTASTTVTTIMLVIARLSILKPLSDQISASGLNLATIDIPELSLRNLTAVYEKDKKSTALIYLQEDNSQLIITHQQQLYFSRVLNFGIKTLENSIEQALLELQRSFDYFQGQWHFPIPERILLESTHHVSMNMKDLFSQGLNVVVQGVDFSEYFTNPLEEKKEGYFLPLLGSVLRKWNKNDATRN